MTRNEPGTPGNTTSNDGESPEEREASAPEGSDPERVERDGSAGGTQYGNMLAAEDASDRETRAERARAADAGDEWARAEQTDAEQADAGQADTVEDARPDRLRHAAEWLDGVLVPKLGPSDLGPYDEESEDSVRSHDACPLCGHPMAEHTIDRSTANAVLNCPAPQRPAPEHFEPLNEVGMIKRPATGE